MIELGRRVKRRRLALGYTQEYVSARVSRKHSWLVAVEKGKGNPPAEIITALAQVLEEDPREYLKLAGRVALTAEDLVPARVADLPPETAAAVERAVSAALTPLVERIDQLLVLLERRQDGPSQGPGLS